MSGNVDGVESDYGICARTAIDLFHRVQSLPDTFAFRFSVLEIYNETLIDLLSDSSTKVIPGPNNNNGNAATKLNVFETENGVLVPGLHVMPIDSADDAIGLFIEAQSNRAVAEHQLNRRSSRSHVIYTYYITRTAIGKGASGQEEPVVHQSKLHIIDLAGSERVNKTGSAGNVQKEANYINKSLSYLEQVVIALAQTNREHIPFRQSKLTYLLKDCLDGNCHTYLIACIWPKKDHSWESLSTLRFAARMKTIETNPVRNRLVAKEQAPSRVIQQQLELLKKELAMRDFVHARETWLPDMTKQQKFQVHKQVVDFVLPSDNVGEMDIRSLSQVHMMLNIMKQTLMEACDGNRELVQQSLVKAMNNMNLITSKGVQKLLSDNGGGGNAEEGVVSNADRTAGNFPNEENNATEQNPSSMQPIAIPDDGKTREEYLQEFALAEGKELNDSYEEAKEALRSNKARQREIVALLNEQKSIIDDLTAHISALSDQELGTEDTELVRERLDTAKKSYRAAHHELQICKEQITETQSLKKRAMNAMLSAFNEYLATLHTQAT